MATSFNIVRNGSIALIAFVLLALPFAAAHAADLGYDSYDTYDYSTPSYDTYDYSTPSYDTYDYSTPSYDTYDYSTPSYDSGYMGGSSYLGGGYMGGLSYLPSSGGNVQSQSQAQSQSSTNVNNNVNNNNVTVNVPTQPQQPIVYQNTPSYPTCNTCGCYGYAACYHPPVVYQNPPIAYNPTPYISLSQAPYTGLDLGFWGTIAYWGFLILWCFVAAYLIVVKKIQNRVLRSLNTFLFGDYVAASHEAAPAPAAHVEHVYSAPVAQVDAIDPFIMSQINRVRA